MLCYCLNAKRPKEKNGTGKAGLEENPPKWVRVCVGVCSTSFRHTLY